MDINNLGMNMIVMDYNPSNKVRFLSPPYQKFLKNRKEGKYLSYSKILIKVKGIIIVMQHSVTTNYGRMDVKTNEWNFDDGQDTPCLKVYHHSHFLLVTQLTIVIYREWSGGYYLNEWSKFTSPKWHKLLSSASWYVALKKEHLHSITVQNAYSKLNDKEPSDTSKLKDIKQINGLWSTKYQSFERQKITDELIQIKADKRDSK